MNNLKNSIYFYIEMNQEILMDFTFTKEQMMFNKEIAPRIRKQDLKKQFDGEAFKKFCGFGYMDGTTSEISRVKIGDTAPRLLQLKRNAYAR